MKETIIYNKNFASIKDLSKDIEINDPYWNSFFNIFNNLFEKAYFQGHRKWAHDSEYDQAIYYLAEQIFIDKRNHPEEILFSVKDSSLMHNRRLASKIWGYYEYSSLVFLGNKRNEEPLIKAYKNNFLHEDIINHVDDILIIYRSFQPDVLWIRSDSDLNKIFTLL